MKSELKWKRDKNGIKKVCTQRMKTEKKNEETKIKAERYEVRESRKQTGSPLNTTTLKRLVMPLLNARSIPEYELRRVKATLFLPSRHEWKALCVPVTASQGEVLAEYEGKAHRWTVPR
jgi:hypothetical protein